MILVMRFKGRQALHINHDIPKEAKTDGARPFLSEMTNTGRLDGRPYIEVGWHYLRAHGATVHNIDPKEY